MAQFTSIPAPQVPKVSKSGDTMTGMLDVEIAGAAEVRCGNTNTDIKVSLEAGSGGANHGIWSYGYYNGSSFQENGKWMIYRNDSNEVIVNGHATEDVPLTHLVTLKEYTVTTTSNEYVSPFGAYAEFDIPSADIANYGWISSIGIINNASTNFCVANFNSTTTKIFVYSKSAATLTLRVLYIKGKD